ncbi:MAG: DUF4870 domain-containing protein [Acidobacteria bacterium]|nr:DUF4870 domain-containing protein [Acidobacteriota bacterium]
MENEKSALGLDGNITALIGYIIWIVALVLIFIEKDNKFVRFHAFQSVFFGLAMMVVIVVLSIFTGILSAVSGTLAGLFSLVFLLVWLGAIVGLIYLCIKAFQGQMAKLPIIGNIAENMANK